MASKRYMRGRYATFEYEDETSAFDPAGRWQGGTECYLRTYRVRVPRGLLAKADRSKDVRLVMDWIDRNTDKPIWI